MQFTNFCPVIATNGNIKQIMIVIFCPGFSAVKRKGFPMACFIMEMSSFEMLSILEAQDNAWSSKFSEMNRKNQ